MKINIDDLKKNVMAEGFEARFVHTEQLTMGYWEVKAGLPFPMHSHHHEQMSYLLEGELEFEMDGKKLIAKPGDILAIPPNAVHGGKAVIDSKLIDVFYPVREDYKKLSEA